MAARTSSNPHLKLSRRLSRFTTRQIVPPDKNNAHRAQTPDACAETRCRSRRGARPCEALRGWCVLRLRSVAVRRLHKPAPPRRRERNRVSPASTSIRRSIRARRRRTSCSRRPIFRCSRPIRRRRIRRWASPPTISSGTRPSPAARSSTTTCSPEQQPPGRLGRLRAARARLAHQQLGQPGGGRQRPSSRSAGTTGSTARTSSTPAPRSAARSRPGENTQVVTRLQYLHAHEDRGTSNSTNANVRASRCSYDQLEAAGAINQRYGRFWTSLGAAAAFIHFDNGDDRRHARSRRTIATA